MAMLINEKSNSNAFASKAMLNILCAGLDILLEKANEHPPLQSNAHIPLATKRAFINAVSEQYGLAALLKIGAGVTKFVDSPIGQALLHDKDPLLLLKKWQRLERYVHSQHFVEFEFFENCVQVKHKSTAIEQPSLEEDLVVLGVLCALLHETSAHTVYLSRSESVNTGMFSYPALACDQAELNSDEPWYIHWSTSINTSVTSHVAQGKQASSQAIVDNTKQAIIALGLLDIELDKVARYLALSQRSLQRHLSAQGHSFAKLLQEVRVNSASHYLLEQSSCAAEIGFICGFADQAHFSRIFKLWTGMTPKQYAQLSMQK
ncbi:AraC family transcriptional regulator [Pseudoalteromonas sp. NEC-BIFX-2020_002]|nr:AraC family transcriptional regulator [Pseudoalteromonas sp. NEC-BIFX-2020_002]